MVAKFLSNKNWLRTGIYFLISFVFIWALLHLVIYATLGAHTLQYLEIWPWIIFISQSFFINAIYFFSWGIILGFLGEKLKNKKVTNYKRLSILLSLFIISISIIFLFRFLPGSEMMGLLFMVIGGIGIIVGLILPWIIAPLLLKINRLYSEKDTIRRSLLVFVILIALIFFLMQAIFGFSQVTHTINCESIPTPERQSFGTNIYEEYILYMGGEIPERSGQSQSEWANTLLQVRNDLDQENSEDYKYVLRSFAYSAANQKKESATSWIGMTSRVNEIIKETPLNYLIDYYTNPCIPDSARIYIIKHIKNKMLKKSYSQTEEDKILQEIKNTIPSFSGKYRDEADENYLRMQDYTKK